jgi:hypothetical protein
VLQLRENSLQEGVERADVALLLLLLLGVCGAGEVVRHCYYY